ncbi:MAG: hypothetical protein NVSMB64_18100 [Candidatus Velthaea sp.]
MAYEVTKIVKGHRYRYRVESVRDQQTGRARAQWTYLGRIGDDDVVVPRRHSTSGNVERIIAAIIRLLERRNIEHVTMTVIAREAGVAPGTIYRHFRSRRAAILAAVRYVNKNMFERIGKLEGQIGSPETERIRLRAWIEGILTGAVASPALMQAMPALVDAPGEFDRALKQYDPGRAYLAEYMRRLAAAGLLASTVADTLAAGVYLMLEGVFRVALNEREHFTRTTISDAALVVERAVFGP